MLNIISTYEESAKASSQEKGLWLFYNMLHELYADLFEGATAQRPYPEYEETHGIKEFCNYNLYFDNINGVPRFILDSDIWNYEWAMRLLDGLKGQLCNGEYRPIRGCRTRTEKLDNFEGKVVVFCEHRISLLDNNIQYKEREDKTQDLAWAFTKIDDRNVFHGIVSHDKIVIFDFWDYPWESIIYFVASALVTYYVEYGSFEAIKICEKCKKMHMPRRRGEDRGRFCSDACRKASYNNLFQDEICCIQKQRNYLNHKVKLAYEFDEIEVKRLLFQVKCIMPDITICKECPRIKNGKKVKGGDCQYVSSNEMTKSIIKEYIKSKKEKKKI